jgi:hypothetical protein
MILRMMLMAASCPSNKLAAVTMRTLFLGLYGSGAVCPAMETDFSFFSEVAVAMNYNLGFKNTDYVFI